MTRTLGRTIFILTMLLSPVIARAQDRLLSGNIHAPTLLGIAFVKNDSAGVVMLWPDHNRSAARSMNARETLVIALVSP